ncbi:hypothetical protein JEQ12_012024 [Ovis aries]|uniref:Uncharacterized protein n=1 Tax=Ovis aries TaxID=9940 RepID=A0A836CS92_SHEEP|nr:hypothetical protein JEQ12_012024 [Ovis aries]
MPGGRAVESGPLESQGPHSEAAGYLEGHTTPKEQAQPGKEAVRPVFWTLLPPTERAVGEVCGTKSGKPGIQLGFGSALWDPEQVMELLLQTQSKD